MAPLGFYFAMVFVCNLTFNTCDYHQSKTGFLTREDCYKEAVMQARRAIEALNSQGSFEDKNHYQWHVFGICDLKPGQRKPA